MKKQGAVLLQPLSRRATARCVLLIGAMVMGMASAGCGDSAKGDLEPQVLTTPEAKHALLQLPYAFQWRSVSPPARATGALAGRVVGKHHTALHFGVALGEDPEPVPVPRSGTEEAFGYLAAGYIYTSDLQVPDRDGEWHQAPQLKTEAQWFEANRMEVAIEEKLCRTAAGEPCQGG